MPIRDVPQVFLLPPEERTHQMSSLVEELRKVAWQLC